MTICKDIDMMVIDCPKFNGPISLEECNKCMYNGDPLLSDNHSWIQCNYNEEEEEYLQLKEEFDYVCNECCERSCYFRQEKYSDITINTPDRCPELNQLKKIAVWRKI